MLEPSYDSYAPGQWPWRAPFGYRYACIAMATSGNCPPARSKRKSRTVPGCSCSTPTTRPARCLTTAEPKEVADVCRRHDLVAVTDEAYEHLVFDGRRHMPLATFEVMRTGRSRFLQPAVVLGDGSESGTGPILPPNLSAGCGGQQFLTYVTPAPPGRRRGGRSPRLPTNSWTLW